MHPLYLGSPESGIQRRHVKETRFGYFWASPKHEKLAWFGMVQPLEYPEAPGWKFSVVEFSYGAYRADGLHDDGRSVSRQGSDYDDLLRKIVADAVGLPKRRKMQ
jgi:hypothetical protein